MPGKNLAVKSAAIEIEINSFTFSGKKVKSQKNTLNLSCFGIQARKDISISFRPTTLF